MSRVSCQFCNINKFPELMHLSAVIPGGGVIQGTYAGKPEMGELDCFCTFVARSPDRPSGFVVLSSYSVEMVGAGNTANGCAHHCEIIVIV